MKFSFSTNAFRQYSFKEAVDAIASSGYDGIEIMCDTPHAFPSELTPSDIDDIKKNVVDSGLTIANLNAFMMCAVKDFHHPSWIEPDQEFRKLRIQYTLDCILLAEKLGVSIISTEPGGPLDPSMSRPQALEIFAEGLEQVLPVALDKGISILIEPEPDLLIETSGEYLEFMETYGSPGLGLNFDVGHFYCVGEDPIEQIFALSDYIQHFHLEDIPKNREHQHILLGEGGIDICGVLQAIEDINYQGFVTIELYPYLETASAVAQKARHYIESRCGL